MKPNLTLFAPFCLLVILPFAAAHAQTEALWSRHHFPTTEGNVLPYRMLLPMDMEEGDTYPLVVFLHGAGERGDDNVRQLAHIARHFEDSAIRVDHRAYVIFPQVPQDQWWSGGKWDRESVSLALHHQTGEYLAAVMHLVDSLQTYDPIDPNRIYLGGLSMGGFGTWDALARWPERFAAAFPICGAGDPTRATLMKDVPIWVFHGDADPVVPVACSRVMVEALREAGAQVIYTEFDGVGHDSWSPAFETRHLIDWIFAQSK